MNKYFRCSPFAGYDLYRIDKEERNITGKKHWRITRIAYYREDAFDASGTFGIKSIKEEYWDERQMKAFRKEINLHTVIKDLFTSKIVR